MIIYLQANFLKYFFLKCSFSLLFILPILLGVVTSDAQISKRPLIFHNWPPKNSKQIAGKQRTLVVQIRSDQPVPLMFKGRPNNMAQHAHHQAHAHSHSHVHALPHPMALHSVPLTHLRNVRPIKLSAPVYLKAGPVLSKPLLRKPLKIKLNNSKVKSKPVVAFEKPFKFEKPTTEYYYELQSTTENERNKLPLETTFHLLNDRYAPIHTIPAPNLSLQDNHLHADDIKEENKSNDKTKNVQKTTQSQSQQQQKQVQQQQHKQQQQSYTSQTQESSKNQYQVFEEQSNDQTIIDPHSNTQKLFAPDPDPSLPTSKLKLATEHFNQPSNGKPLPVDVQSNHLPVAQPLVLAQPELYPVQYTQQAAALQPFISANLAAIQPAAPIPLYNPTYLVQQSNNLYTQHKQQLFNTPIVEAGYYNADLTQAVAADGSIVQPSVDTTSQFTQPLAQAQSLFQPAAIRLPNTGVSSSEAPETGFVASHYYENDSSQLLQAYAEEEAQRQRLETEEAAIRLEQHQQREQAEQELLLQQKHNHLLELQQQQHHQQQYILQQQQQHQQQQQQQQHQQQQQQQHQNHQQELQQLQRQQQQEHNNNPATTAFEEHTRLVQQQLGTDTPLRIFVPDEESAIVDLPRLQKRSDKMKKGSVEDVDAGNRSNNSKNNNNMGVEVSSSVEVSSANHSSSSEADKRMDDYDEQNDETK